MAGRPAKRAPLPGEPAAARPPVAEIGTTVPAATEQEAGPHRAGGHVDRGDGRGWVLEETEG